MTPIVSPSPSRIGFLPAVNLIRCSPDLLRLFPLAFLSLSGELRQNLALETGFEAKSSDTAIETTTSVLSAVQGRWGFTEQTASKTTVFVTTQKTLSALA